ncbi:uncharacterized protein RHIMIDRAFT_246683 [Rhizopus microsporus ATCC 52813]|uniref:Uncharacterized protein n=1 Tax=Rhizopus microsporus ATCC 52813 TaxID=1340429 RepID=A0A2G4T508_RHIZD|nr:uncharacterized protein RHIMIDRAFT_246683 [Rhizopus microsporus ATCC 52813]PHZ16097.1 hypothetical protein RHIMIDRAFT_246683 [Rhizopus microsporus ATCC 52813]
MISVRLLHVLKKDYFAKIIERIVFLLHDHQTEIRNLKQQEFTVIGYARKSKSGEDVETRTRLLNLMCKRLKERSLVDHVFVSYASQGNDQLAKRDLKQTSETYKGLHAEGSTQDMMRFITNTEKVCLVVLDYAGLSTNSNDLYENLLRRTINILTKFHFFIATLATIISICVHTS